MMIIIPSHGETKRPTDAQKMEVCFNAQCQCRILFTHTNSHTTACVQKNKPESIPRARHPDDTPTPTGPMERLMRDLRRLEDEIHASTSSPTRTGTTRRRSRSVTPTTGGSPARGARIGFLTNDDVADDDAAAAAAGDARTRLRDARAAIEDAAKALAVEEETEMRRGRALGALDGRTTVAHAGDKETTTKRVATTTTTTKRIRRNDDGDDDIDALTTPVVPRETRSTRAATTPMS